MAISGVDLSGLKTPILLRGDETTAYRDPAAVLHEGCFYLFYTLVKTEADGKVYLYTALSESRDLRNFTSPKILTPRDQNLNFSSPGNVLWINGEWALCLQTYPRPDGAKYGTKDSRVWIMRSRDLRNWGEPELLRVKGPDVPDAEMGRMIDPYLLPDQNEPGKYWCFFKQNGVSLSHSRDLRNWTYAGYTESGENVCVLTQNGEYVLFHSPHNGIGVMRSRDLHHWTQQEELITLGQKNWSWAQGRLTAGFILDCRNEPDIGKYLLFFHGTGPEDEEKIFDTHACIGIAWSDDLRHWAWPGSAC